MSSSARAVQAWRHDGRPWRSGAQPLAVNPHVVGGGEGSLRIRVQVEAGVIVAVALSSTRPVGMSAALVGREIGAAMRLLPRLFNLCGVAQAVAGLAAAETALGFVPPPPQTAARRFLVAAEALEQTAWRLLLDWPRSVGADPALDAMKRLRQLLSAPQPRLFPATAWNRIGGSPLVPNLAELGALLDGIEQGIYQAIYGLAPGDRQFPDDLRSFERWLCESSTSAAATLRHVREHGLADFGRSAVEPLPAFDAGAMERRLAAEDGDSFCARPDLDGTVYETGALPRLWRHPLIAELRADYGNGLLVRLAARVIECHALLVELRGQLSLIGEHPGTAPMNATTGVGLGVVESARGRLVHRLVVAEGRVTDYKILAPTEWNFHPEGSLAHGLMGARVGGDAAVIRRAITLLVTALDPCVGFHFDIEERQ